MHGWAKRASHEGERGQRTLPGGDMGSALLVVLAAAAILFVTVAAVVGVVVFQQTQLSYAQGVTRSSQLAQQGMEYYLAALKVDPQYWETTPAIAGSSSDGTWTVAANVSASTLTAVGHDRLTGLLHVIKAKVRPEVFADYTIVSGSTLKLGDSVTPSQLSITGEARGNNGIQLAQDFPGLHVSTPSSVGTADAGGAIDFSKAESALPHMFTAASDRQSWGDASQASPLAFYRDPNDPTRNYWGDATTLEQGAYTKNAYDTEPERVGVGVDFTNGSDPAQGLFYIRAIFPPVPPVITASGTGTSPTSQQLTKFASQDPIWNLSLSGERPPQIQLANGDIVSNDVVTPKYLNPNGNNVIYVGGQYDAYVKGEFSRSVTIVSEHDIYIMGSVTRAQGTTATVGLVAKGNIYICGAMPDASGLTSVYNTGTSATNSYSGQVYTRGYWNGTSKLKGEVLPSTGETKIQAALMAIDGGIYMDPASVTASSTSGPAKRTGATLKIEGSLAANKGLGGPNFVNIVNPTIGGFGRVEISHDPLLSDNPPPLYPQLGSGGMKVVSWDEYTTRTDPNIGVSFVPIVNGYKQPTQSSDGSWVFDPSGDKQAPLTVANVKPEYSGDAIITLTPTDTDAGVWRTYYTVRRLNGDGTWTQSDPVNGTTIDIPSPPANEVATYTVTYWSVDNAGNSEVVQTSSPFRMVGPDTIPPVTTAVDDTTGDDLYGKVIPDGYPLSGNPEVVWGAFTVHLTSVDTSTGLGADRIWYRTLQGTDVLSDYTGTIDAADGSVKIPAWVYGPRDLTFQYYGIDKAGNGGPMQTFRVTQHAADLVAPTTLMTQSRTPGGTTVYLTATDDPAGRGVKDISYKIDDGAWVSSTSDPTTITIPAPASGSAQHTITYYARDIDLNAEAQQTATLTVVRVPTGHTTPPVTTCDAQPSYIGPAVITLSPSDEIGVQGVYWKLNGGAQQTGTRVDAPAPLTGSISYTLEYWAVDFANNEETPHKTASFVVYPEQTPPVTTAHNLDLYNTAAVVQLSAQDEPGGSGVKSTYYKVDGGDYQLGTALVGPQWVTVTGDGLHTVSFYSVDNAGNTETVKSTTFRIDTTAPTTISDNAGTYTGQAAVHLTASDPGGSGVAKTYWKASDGRQQTFDPVLLGPGTWDVSYWSVDKAGNIEAPKTFHCVVTAGPDVSAPMSYDDIVPYYRTSAPTINLYSWDVQTGVQTMYYTLDGVAHSQSGTFNPPWGYAVTVPGADASHTIEYWAADKAGNSESPHHVATFTVDSAMPVTTLRDAAGVALTPGASVAYWSNQTFSLDPVDTGSGVKATYYAVDGGEAQLGTLVYLPASTTGAPEAHTVDYWSVDNAGNTEVRRSVRITSEQIDTVSPTTVSDMAPAYRAPATVQLTAYDNYKGSGVAHTYYKLDGAGQTEGTLVGISSIGKHTLEYWSVDQAGNVETHHTQTCSIDVTSPVSSSNAVAWYAGSASISITATDNVDGSGVGTILYRLDGGAVTTGTVPTTVVTTSTAGSHTLEFWSIDVAGNVETSHKSVNFGIDNTAPLTTSNAVGAYTTGAAVITLMPTDIGGSGVKSTYYTVDGGVVQWGTSITVPAPISGNPVSHTITYWSVDNVGNVETQRTASFTVAATANMTFSAMTPPELSTITLRNPTVSVTANCDRAITAAAATLDGVPAALTVTNPGGYWVYSGYWTGGCGSYYVDTSYYVPVNYAQETATFNAAELANGPHTVTFTFTASSGLKSVKTWVFTVSALADVKAPVTTSDAVSYYSTPATITLNAADEIGGTGLAATYYRLDGGTVTTGTAPSTKLYVSAAGSHDLEFWSADRAGNVETHHTAHFCVDYIAPTTGSDAIPSSTGSYKGDTTVTLSPVDNVGGSGVKATYYRVDTGVQQAGTAIHLTAPISVNGPSTTHTILFWSVDNAGNVETANSVTVSLRPGDDVPPHTISDVKSQYDFKGTISLTASDNVGGSGLAATCYRLDGGSVTTSTATSGAGTSSTTFSTGGLGPHTLTYWSVDIAGNVEGSHVETYTVLNEDTTPPRTKSDATSSYYASATISLTASDNVGGSGVAATYYQVDSGTQQTGTTVKVGGPVAGSAAHTLKFWSVDKVGNVETANTATFTITAAPADMSFDNWAPGKFETTTTRNFTVQVHAIAASATISAVSAIYDGAAKTASLAYDGTYHKQSTWVPPQYTTDGCYTYEIPGYWADTSYWTYDYTKATASFPVTNQVDGTHTVSFTFTVAGGMQKTESWSFCEHGPDSQPPTTTANVQPTYIATATISLDATDGPVPPNSGVAFTYYRLDSGARQSSAASPTVTNVTVAPPVWGWASHTIAYWSVDGLGNTETEHTASFLVRADTDTIAPTTTSTVQPSYVGTAAISLIATDNPGGWGVANTHYTVDGSAPQTGTAFVVGPPSSFSATHTITFWSDDRWGNVEVAKTATFTINAPPDATPPTTTSNAVLYYQAPSTISLSATDNIGGWGVANTYYQLDGGAETIGTSVATGTYGKHTLLFWSRDWQGNAEVPHSVTYWVDNTAPHTTRDPIASYDGTATIVLTPTDGVDGSGVKATYYTVDGGGQQTGTTITVAPPTSSSASHTIVFWSIDNAGNAESANTATFVVNAPADHTAPTTLSDAVATYAKPATITLSATDNFGGWGVASTYYILDGAAQQAGLTLGTGGAGTHTLEFWSVDKAGNIESHKTVTYTVTADTTPPVTTSDAVALYIGPAVINLSATDSGWGVKATYYTVDGSGQQTGTKITIPAPISGSAAHTVTFWSVDNAGNTEVAHVVNVSVSGVPASITWSAMAPAAGATLTTSSATVSVVGDAAENVTGVTATLDGTATPVTWSQPAGTWVDQGYWDTSGCYAVWVPVMVYVPGDLTIATSRFDASGLSDGSHTVAFTYTVASGKTATKSWTFNVSTDLTAPTTTSDAKSLYNGAASVKLTATDNAGGSGVKATYYKIDAGAQQTGSVIAVPAPASGSATHTVTFWSVDNAGNTETAKSATFAVWAADNTAPTTTSTAQPFYLAPSTITLTATDNVGGSGVAHTYYALDGAAQVEGTVLGTGGEGKHTLEFWSVDKLGNVETPHKIVTYTVDMTPPTTTSDAKSAYQGSATEYTGVAMITLTPTDTPTGSGIKSTYYTVDGGAQTAGTSILINGPTSGFDSHSITFWSIDNAGNTEAAHTATFTVAAKPDTTPPTTTSNALSSYSVPGMIQLYATDNVGGWGLAHTYYRLDGGSQVESMTVGTGGPGTHTLEFWSTDRAGNEETPHKMATYTVLAADSAPPVTTSNAVTAYVGPATITLTASDDSGLMPFTYYRIDDGAQQWGTTVLVPAPVTGSVTHTVYFWSVDNAGNIETTKSATFSVTALPADMTFTALTPPDGSTITVRNPTLSLTAQAVNNIVGATGTIDGVAKSVSLVYPTWGDFTKATATLPATGLENRVHTATMTFTDSIGAQCTKTWTFTVNAAPDTTAPTTTEETIISGGVAQVRLTATDDGGLGVASTYYRLDGGTQFTGTPPVTTVSVGAGSHTLEYWSVDLAGNTESHQTASFTIDITPPTTLSNARTTYTGVATITLSPSDNVGGSGVKATYYQVDTGAVSTGTVVAVAPPASSDPATHTVYFWSVDNAGNIEATRSATFTVWAPLDGTPPTTTSNAVSSYTTTGVITLTAVDNVGGWGVAHTYYKLDGGTQAEGTSVPVGAAGAHTLEFWSVDKAGNAESPHTTVTYTVVASAMRVAPVRVVDTTPPTTVSDAVGDYVGIAAIIQLTASDGSGSGVAHTYWRVDGGAQTEGTMLGVSGVGEHTVEFWSVDNAGNVETPHKSVKITISAPPDTTAPVTTSDARASYTGAATIALTAADEEGGSGVRTTFYRIDGGAQTEGTSISVAPPAAGTLSHTIEFWSVDNAGNVEKPSSATFAVTALPDATAPSTASDASASYVGPALIRLTATDNGGGSGVAGTYYRLDGGAQTAGTAVEIAAPVTGSQLHTIEFWSVDNAGNVEMPHKTATFTVMASDAPVATLSFLWGSGAGQTTLHVENEAGATIASKVLSGSGTALDWQVQVPAGATYKLVCDYYSNAADGTNGGGYSTWSGILNAGQEYVWRY